MKKDATYKEKYANLKDWMPFIIESTKKDLKNEHLKKDVAFIKKYLNNKNLNKITTEELVSAYNQALTSDDAEPLGEFITARWLMRHSDVYDYFERQLTQINPEFTDLELLTPAQSQPLIEGSIKQFGAVPTYLFSVMNSVVFPEEAFKDLETRARKEKHHQAAESEKKFKQQSIDHMQQEFEQEIARLTDKYEKKLSGLQKKYLIDVESLKKQVANLQRKLQEKS